MKTTEEIRQLSDGNLLEYLCLCEGDEVAYSIFVGRFFDELQGICESICKRRRLDSHIGRQIVSDTFEKIRRYKSYKRSEENNKDERKAVIGFLYKVASNLFIDYYNKNKRAEEPYSSYFDSIKVETGDIGKLASTKAATLKILKVLNDKEKKVLITDVEYKRHYKYLPDEVVASLCKELNLKPSSLRKVRERALYKIQKAIAEYNELQ